MDGKIKKMWNIHAQGNPVIYYNMDMDTSRGHHAMWNKPVTEGQVSCGSIAWGI